MFRTSSTVLLVTLAASAALAADFPAPVASDVREAVAMSRFVGLERPAEPGAGDRFAVTGLNITQEAGQAKLGVQQVQVSRAGKTTLISELELTTPLTVDDAYLNNPVGGLLAALVKKGEVRIGRIDTSGKAPATAGTSVRDLQLVVGAGSFEGSLVYGSFRARATGSLAYDAGARKLVVTLKSVSAGIPIGLDRVFQALASALTFDWTVVKKPTITLVFDETYR
ncbi:MAG: hypothetical protein HY814_04375 [Candidatus Riflebacteria bacterium]|nr:hypothetical protein [Candidatus Riflebacteria bacterium]